MKLATIKSANPKERDGQLIVVSKDNQTAVKLDNSGCRTLKEALENWESAMPIIERVSRELNEGKAAGSFALDVNNCVAPLPNAAGFYDGSAFLSHVHRARKSRGDVMPESAKITPLMYQGVSDNLLPFNAPIELISEEFGGDFEGEFAVITTDVPKGTIPENIDKYMVLLCLLNDISYRELIKKELPTKFGFLQSKPNSSFAPFVITPDELGSNWKGGRVELDLLVKLNGKEFGRPNGREMHFSFQQLVSHACRTRPLAAGSIIGSGTVSNDAKETGFACLTEKRFQEIMDSGKPSTRWLKPGDHVFIDAQMNGLSVFGYIDEEVVL